MSDIVKMRNGMWEKVAKRSHRVDKIFPFGAGSNEVMLYGSVKYAFKTGDEAGSEWAARAVLVEEGSQLKMDFYQVFLVRPSKLSSSTEQT